MRALLPIMPVTTRRKRSRRNARAFCFSGVENVGSGLLVLELISSCSVIFCPGDVPHRLEIDTTGCSSWRSQREDRVRVE